MFLVNLGAWFLECLDVLSTIVDTHQRARRALHEGLANRGNRFLGNVRGVPCHRYWDPSARYSTSRLRGGEGTSVDIYFDKWVKFTEEPKVCNGVLTMSGRLTNGARFARSTDDLLAFVLYRHRDSDGGTQQLVLGFLKPLEPGWSYDSLAVDDQIAQQLYTEYQS